MTSKLIYCFDLDETLCYIPKEFGRDYSKALPYEQRINTVNKLFDEGHTILIDSARGSTIKNKKLKLITKNQLKKWNLKYHKLRISIKFTADIYVDNAAINDMDFFKCPK